MEKENNLKKLEKEYLKLQKKYSLPTFNELNENFGIEKISTDEIKLLLRTIRNFISEKLANYMRIVENLLNPVNVPMFVYSIVKNLEEKNKENLKEIYKELTEIEMNLIEVDLDYSEKKEAEFIKNSFESWRKIKKQILEIIKKAKENPKEKTEKNNKNYFG